MKKFYPLAIIAISFFMLSCSDDSESPDTIAEQTLMGTVMGDPFLATGGKAFVNPNGSISLSVTNTVADCSTDILDFVYYVSADVPNRIGFHRNVIVIFGKENEAPLNVLNSIVEITEITATELTGKIKSISSTDDNRVEGSFTISLCTS
ncbi:hypothetical protein GWK08_14125 [Leptobacterium flavescens]|uniref:Lipoprotein n=1 Tax=Leptobacterium flavescens TaxID=472055 RepID=A0A6P0URJ2_9FLAO|nr:hypothetical protein [Leptobacterium flavescens]NER14588.1 hypothetical protein [Leptobacterium flavescens]